MFLIYKPEGQPEQRWHFTPGRIHSGEMILLEKHSGMDRDELVQRLLMGNTRARQALLWTMLRREHQAIKFEDVGFYDDELVLQRDKDELAAEIEGLTNFDGVTEAERDAGLALLRSQLATAPDAPGKAPTATHAAPEPPLPPSETLLPPQEPPAPVVASTLREAPVPSSV